VKLVHKKGYNHLTLDLYLRSLQLGRECSQAGHYIAVTVHFPHSAKDRLVIYLSIEQFRILLSQMIQLGQIQSPWKEEKLCFFGIYGFFFINKVHIAFGCASNPMFDSFSIFPPYLYVYPYEYKVDNSSNFMACILSPESLHENMKS